MRKFLLGIFLIVLVILMLYKSPFSGMYYYNAAKKMYDAGQYEKSIPIFEKSLFSDPKNLLARFNYVLALSKAKPTLSVQKKLYDMGNSKFEDEAKKYARFQAVSLRHKLLKGLEGNYIHNAMMGNDILRWDLNTFPLKFYIENPNTVPAYYVTEFKNALKQWTNRTNFVKFQEVSDAASANILIKFKNIPDDICTGNVCPYVVAYTEPVVSGNKILQKMELNFYKTNPKMQNFSPREIYNTSLHEIGHTLGIMGHSDSPSDIMYSSSNGASLYAFYTSSLQYLSLQDLKTLALLYRIQPTITNTKNINSENLYYAPLILGSEDARLRKKIEEYTAYIRQYPNFAAGYINISSVYVDMGDFDSALAALDKALPLAKTTDEQFLIYYNKSIIYYNKQDKSAAFNFALKAKSIKDDANVTELISDIKKL